MKTPIWDAKLASIALYDDGTYGGHFNIEFSEPVGRTVLQFKYTNDKVRVRLLESGYTDKPAIHIQLTKELCMDVMESFINGMWTDKDNIG